MEWKAVYYNGLETNIEVTKCGKVRKIPKEWLLKKTHNFKFGYVDFNKLKLTPQGYQVISIQIKDHKKRAVQVQQLVAAAFLNYKWNGHKLVVDHIDENPLNNNLNNLQIITHRQNMSKERTIKSGLPTGVWYNKKLDNYQANININNKQFYLGTFNSSQEAANAYQNKLKQL
jgi:hypothetical protein